LTQLDQLLARAHGFVYSIDGFNILPGSLALASKIFALNFFSIDIAGADKVGAVYEGFTVNNSIVRICC
jgi:hypothetical protein